MDDVVEVVRKDSLRIAKERLQKARDDITQSIQDIIDLQTDTLSAQHSDLADELAEMLQDWRKKCGTTPLHPEHYRNAANTMLNRLTALRSNRAAIVDYIDLFRIIRRAGRSDKDKAKAVAQALGINGGDHV